MPCDCTKYKDPAPIRISWIRKPAALPSSIQVATPVKPQPKATK